MPDLMAWGALELTKLKDDLDRRFAALCDDFGLARTALPTGEVRISKRDGEWVLNCPLPGFEPENVTVTVTGRVVSIVAVKKSGQGGGLLRLSRELALPFLIDQAQADFEGGELTIRLARQAPPQERAIPVTCKPNRDQCLPSSSSAGTDENDRSPQ